MSHPRPISVLMMFAAFVLLATSAGVHGGVLRNYNPDAAMPVASQPAATGASNAQRPSYFQSNYRYAAAANSADSGAASGAAKQPAAQSQSHQQQVQLQQSLAAANLPPMLRPGISAWGLIALIVFVILIGMAGYYGIMCYPLFCHKDGNYYNTMREASSTSSETPLGVGTFDEKLGDYSTRSTTPSKSHE